MRVLIIGGYGTFGGRLARLLMDDSRLTLILAGRSLGKARTFIEGLDARATFEAHALNRDGDLKREFSTLKPDLVADASGPFQNYGEDRYRVVEAALDSGAHYLDLADGTDFVASITEYNAAAQERELFAISGASTFPALSSAVIRELTQGWTHVTKIEAALAPSPKAGLGGNVIRAILSYAGKPLAILRDGETVAAPALIDARRLTIAPPGSVPLPRMQFTLVDVPDLSLMSKAPGLQDLWVGVATRPQILQRVLSLLARLVQWKLLRSLSAFSGLAEAAMRTFPVGEHRGGMCIRAEGSVADGTPLDREWHMIAEGDDGPFIPAMAAEAIIRRTLDGRPPPPGARPALEEVTLADYDRAFSKRHIQTGFRRRMEGFALYERMLGEAWHRLPQPIRALHSDPDGKVVRGEARVERGSNPFARLAAAVVGFPKAGSDIPVEVRFTERDGEEIWERNFAGKRFRSFQREGAGRFSGLLAERFGPLEFGLALVIEDEKLCLVTRGWRAFGIPMPRFLAPGGEAFEHVVDGRFHFHVEISHPLIGLIVRYRGWLEPTALPKDQS